MIRVGYLGRIVTCRRRLDVGWLLSLVVLAGAMPWRPSLAADAPTDVSPVEPLVDGKLPVTGYVGSAAISFGLGLIAKGASCELVPYWGSLAGDTVSIPRQAITVGSDGNITLTKGIPRYVPITVAAQERAGGYTGWLSFYDAVTGDQLLRVQLVLTVADVPRLTMADEKTTHSYDLAHPGGCAWLTKRIVHPSDCALELYNPTDANVPITEVTAWAVRNDGAHSFAEGGWRLTPTARVVEARGKVRLITTGPETPAGSPGQQQSASVAQQTSAPFNISAVEPGHYSGQVYVLGENRRELLKTAVEMNVRSAPYVPFVLLAIGILLGLVTNWWTTTGQRLVDCWQAYLGALDKVNRDFTGPADLDALAKGPLARVKGAAEAGDQADTKAKVAALDLAEAQLHEATTAISEYVAGPKPDPGTVTQAAALLEKLRTAIEKVDEGAANAQLQALKQLLATPPPPQDRLMLAGPTPTLLSTGQLRVAKVLRVLSGVSVKVSAPFAYHVAQPVFAIALVVGLCIVGLYTQYLRVPTFGAQGFADYFGLVMWGLGAEVAGAKFSDLPTLWKKTD